MGVMSAGSQEWKAAGAAAVALERHTWMSWKVVALMLEHSRHLRTLLVVQPWQTHVAALQETMISGVLQQEKAQVPARHYHCC